MVYIISYDLAQPERNYKAVQKVIEVCSCGKFVHPLGSVYLISSMLTSDKLTEMIKSAIDKDDSFLICEINSNYQGYIKSEYWKDIEKLFA